MSFIGAFQRLMESGKIQATAANPLSRYFDRSGRPRLGASLFPVSFKDPIEDTIFDIQTRTLVADVAGSFQRPTLKRGNYTQYYDIRGFNIKIASELTPEEVEIFVMLGMLTPEQADPQIQARITNHLDLTILEAISQAEELKIWELLMDGVVNYIGDGGQHGQVTYPVIDGQRRTVGGNWADPSYDPLEDLIAAKEWLEDNDRTPSRTFMRKKARNLLLRHPEIIKRAGRGLVISTNGSFTNTFNNISVDELNTVMLNNDLPPISPYDGMYTLEGLESPIKKHYIPDDKFIMLTVSGADDDLEFNFNEYFAPSTPNYQAIRNGILAPDRLGRTIYGRNRTQTTLGRSVLVVPDEQKSLLKSISFEGSLRCGIELRDFLGFVVVDGITYTPPEP